MALSKTVNSAQHKSYVEYRYLAIILWVIVMSVVAPYNLGMVENLIKLVING